MCYNATSSLANFIISLAGIIFLFIRNEKNDRFVGNIIFGVSIMQIGEYLIHLDLKCKKNLNKVGSRIGYLSHIILQPLFGLISLLYFNERKITKTELIIWLITYLIYFFYSCTKWPKDKDFCTYKNKCKDKKHCSLFWPWEKSINMILYTIIVFIIPVFFSGLNNKIIHTAISGIGILITALLRPKTKSSIWCFISPLLIISSYIFVEKIKFQL